MRLLITLEWRLWACSDDKPTSCIRRSGADFLFQKMEYLDPVSSILPSFNILVSLGATTSMLKRASSLQTGAALRSGLAPS